MPYLPHPDTAVIAIFSALLVLAAGHDAVRFRIPNWASIAIAAIYPLHVLSSPSGVAWGAALGLAAVVFAIGLILFARGIVGGGDVKLLTATALWAGVEHGADFLAVTVLAGGALSLVLLMPAARNVLAHAYDCFGAGGAGNPIADKQVPYGIAIAVGGLACAVLMVAR